MIKALDNKRRKPNYVVNSFLFVLSWYEVVGFQVIFLQFLSSLNRAVISCIKMTEEPRGRKYSLDNKRKKPHYLL